MQADGNCFFRAISEALYGQQDDHQEIRDTLINFIVSNKDVFVKFIPSTAESIDKHLQRMQQKGTWATHLEIFAATSLLQIPIYVAAKHWCTTGKCTTHRAAIQHNTAPSRNVA